MLKKLVSLFLVLVIFSSISASAIDSRASSRINGAGVTLERERNGKLTISLYIRTNGSMQELGAQSIVIQRYNGSSWVTEHTIKSSENSSLLEQDDSAYDVDISYVPVYSNLTYRAVVTFYAKDSEGASTKTVTSQSV